MRRDVLLLLLVVPVILFVLDRQGLLDPVRGAAWRAAAPVTGSVTRLTLTVAETVRAVAGIRTLMREHAALTAENRRLRAELADKEDIIHENDLLRTELGLPERGRGQQGLAAFVIGRTGSGTFGVLEINRGRRDGLREGQVVVSEGALVGRIIQVSEATSTVLPITNVNSTIPVVLVQSRGVGLLRGGVRGLVVEEIPRDVEVVPGESVVTSTLGGVVPEGILVGTVEEVLGYPADVFRTVAVRSPVPFNWLEVVVVRP
jgi:rod shape-determining protein MreC